MDETRIEHLRNLVDDALKEYHTNMEKVFSGDKSFQAYFNQETSRAKWLKALDLYGVAKEEIRAKQRNSCLGAAPSETTSADVLMHNALKNGWPFVLCIQAPQSHSTITNQDEKEAAKILAKFAKKSKKRLREKRGELL